MATKNATTEAIPFDEIALPSGGTMKKTDVYDWKTIDSPGKFAWIPKFTIGVDHTYQRELVNESRINRIAARLSWRKFATIQVVASDRDEHLYWCFDGQHRLLAAKKRSDILKVPCMIFASTGEGDEADAFLGSNGDRGAVRTMEKFKALLTTGDPVANAIKTVVEGSNYHIGYSNAKNHVRCIGALYRAFDQNAASAKAAWQVCVGLYRGEAPIDRVFIGLWALDNAMRDKQPARSILDTDCHKAILKAGAKKLNDSIGATSAYLNRSGQKVFGAGVAAVINKGLKSRNYVPSLLPGTDE